MSLTFQFNGQVPEDLLACPTFDEAYEMRMVEEFGDDYNGYSNNDGILKSNSSDNFLQAQWSGRNFNGTDNLHGTTSGNGNGSGSGGTRESCMQNNASSFDDVRRVWPTSGGYTAYEWEEKERLTPQMMPYNAAGQASRPGHTGKTMALTAYQPVKSRQDDEDQMQKVVALARKLNMSGVLRDPNETPLQLEEPTFCKSQLMASPPAQFLNRNIGPTSAGLSDRGAFARPRNHSLPDAANSYSNVPASRMHLPHNYPLQPPWRQQDVQRKRNPYALSAPLEYNKTIRRGSSDNTALNPYAPNAFSNASNGNTLTLGNGIHSNTHNHSQHIPNRSSYGRPAQKANWPATHGRSTETRRHASGNNKNPLLQPPPTEDFFASMEQSNADTQRQLQLVQSFGEYGAAAGQFNMPQGLCLGMNDEMIVADTLNHRIQIFDQSGKFMFLWGCPGVKKGQLWHPRKVAYIPATEHVVVSDRVNGCSRIQIFERTGQYLTTLGNLHGLRMALNTTTAGLTVYNNQIIVVEVQPSACVVLNEDGSVVYWFSLDGIMVEPSDVVVINEKHYISDFREHCVCVFNNWGHLIQRLGACQDGLIRFPRGLALTPSGHLLVADTDLNRFHISLWNCQNGQLVSYHGLNDIKVSHSCGVVMNSSGQVMTAVKKDDTVLMLELGQNVPAGMVSRDNGHLQRGWNVHAATFHSRVDQMAS